MVPTSNPVRKLNKKIRLSKEKGEHEKAKLLQQELDHILKCQAINQKNKMIKEEKKNKNNLTDDMFMDQCKKENKKSFKERQELERKERENKKKSEENIKHRAKILQAKKDKDEQEQKNMVQHKLEYDNYKKEEGELNKRLESHEALMKVEKSEDLEKMYDKIMKEIKNKKLANKTYKKQLKQKSMMIEVAIQGYMEQHDVLYEEACNFIYGELRKKHVSKSGQLMIDGTAKL
jgi:hypothetical protein